MILLLISVIYLYSMYNLKMVSHAHFISIGSVMHTFREQEIRQALLYKFFAAALLAAVVFVWTAAFMSNTLFFFFFCLFLILF